MASSQLGRFEVVGAFQHERTHEHLGVGPHDVKQQIAAEPIEVIQAEDDLRMAGQEPLISDS
jgi:hypothetical protein